MLGGIANYYKSETTKTRCSSGKSEKILNFPKMPLGIAAKMVCTKFERAKTIGKYLKVGRVGVR